MQHQLAWCPSARAGSALVCRKPVYLPTRQRIVSRSRVVQVQASAKADDVLQKARAKYESKDLLAAMNLFEAAMNEDPTVRQRQAALYGQTAVHAAFGDVELAQITLREAIKEGLDYEQALQDPDLVQINSSPQILIQLRKFNQSAQKALTARTSKSSYTSSNPSPRRATGNSLDLDSILGSSTSDQAQVDTSIPGVIKRVALVLLIGVGLGVGLFYLGLEYMFPKF